MRRGAGQVKMPSGFSRPAYWQKGLRVMTGLVPCLVFAGLFSSTARGLAQLPPHDAIRQTPTPSWVVPVDLEALTSARMAESAAELARLVFHDTQIFVPESNATNAAQTYEQEVFHLDSSGDVEELSTVSLEFDPSYQTLEVHAVRVLRDGEWSDRIGRSLASVAQVEDQLERYVYDQSESLLMILDDVQVGDWLSVEYSLRGSNPVMGDDWADAVWLVSQAVSKRSVRVLAQRPVAFAVHGDAPDPSKDVADGNSREIVWTLENRPEPEYTHSLPWGYSPQPWIQLSTQRTWSDVVDWALPVFEPPPSTPDVREIASRFANLSREQGLLAARRWVQDEIGYFSVAMGEHSHPPYVPSETLARRYGDCKDKTVLLLSVLRELGIDSWPVLINTNWREGLVTFQPSPLAFDHIIVAAAVGDRVIWIDPTLGGQGGDAVDAMTVPNYRYGLEVRTGVAELSEIPERQRAPGLKQVFYHYRVQEDLLQYQVHVKTVFSGAEAEGMRRTLAELSTDELQENYLEYYQAEHLDVSVREPLSITDDREGNVLEVEEHYQVSSSGDAFGWTFYTFELELSGELGYAEADRTAPLVLGHPRLRHEMIRIDVPTPWAFTRVGDVVDNPWFSYVASSKIGPERRSIELEYGLETKSDVVAPADFDRYNQELERVSESLGYGMDTGVTDLPFDWSDLAGDSMFGRDRRAVLGAAVIGGVMGFGVLALLLSARVGDRRLMAYWLPQTQTVSSSTASHASLGVSFADPSIRVLLAVVAVSFATLADLISVPAGLLSEPSVEGLFVLEFLYAGFVLMLLFLAALFSIAAQRQFLRNLRPLGLDSLDPGINWSTFSWFVPLANLFVPYRSYGQVVVGCSAPQDRPVMLRLLGSWWALWVFALFLDTSLLAATSLSSNTVADGLETLCALVYALAAVLFVTLLLVLRANQLEAARRAAAASKEDRPPSLTPDSLAERLFVDEVASPSSPPPPPPPAPPRSPGSTGTAF